jgi:CRP-like cAMP-binding protein
MHISDTGGNESHNFMLASLEPNNYQCLHPKLKAVTLRQGAVLVAEQGEITNVYFPLSGLVSWTKRTTGGDRIDVGMTGREGLIGWPLFCGERVAPYEVEVILPGEAFMLSADSFAKALADSNSLQQIMLKFTYFKMEELAQSALCDRYHTVEERLCRWLLVAQDRTGERDLMLTRDILADMIGARRPAVSLVTGALQTAGLILAKRAKITILNREEMEEAACECYRIMKEASDHYHSTEFNKPVLLKVA